MSLRFLLISVISISFISCNDNTLFTKIEASDSGIQFSNRIIENDSMNILGSCIVLLFCFSFVYDLNVDIQKVGIHLFLKLTLLLRTQLGIDVGKKRRCFVYCIQKSFRIFGGW
jgi:hypothetical protein